MKDLKQLLTLSFVLFASISILSFRPFAQVSFAQTSFAQAKPRNPINNQISQEKLSGAMGHFSRSRSLIIAAIDEFDKGRAVYDPSALMDPLEWRAFLVLKAKELEALLAPKGRESQTGIKYQGDNRLLESGEDRLKDGNVK